MAPYPVICSWPTKHGCVESVTCKQKAGLFSRQSARRSFKVRPRHRASDTLKRRCPSRRFSPRSGRREGKRNEVDGIIRLE